VKSTLFQHMFFCGHKTTTTTKHKFHIQNEAFGLCTFILSVGRLLKTRRK